jgi:hypothetical protein
MDGIGEPPDARAEPIYQSVRKLDVVMNEDDRRRHGTVLRLKMRRDNVSWFFMVPWFPS